MHSQYYAKELCRRDTSVVLERLEESDSMRRSVFGSGFAPRDGADDPRVDDAADNPTEEWADNRSGKF